MAEIGGGRPDAASIGVGAGGGTLLVILAQNISENSPWKSWLVILAPGASVVATTGLSWVRAEWSAYRRRRTISSAFAKTKKHIEDGLKNRNTSEEHKAKLRERLEKIEIVMIEAASKDLDP